MVTRTGSMEVVSKLEEKVIDLKNKDAISEDDAKRVSSTIAKGKDALASFATILPDAEGQDSGPLTDAISKGIADLLEDFSAKLNNVVKTELEGHIGKILDGLHEVVESIECPLQYKEEMDRLMTQKNELSFSAEIEKLTEEIQAEVNKKAVCIYEGFLKITTSEAKSAIDSFSQRVEEELLRASESYVKKEETVTEPPVPVPVPRPKPTPTPAARPMSHPVEVSREEQYFDKPRPMSVAVMNDAAKETPATILAPPSSASDDSHNPKANLAKSSMDHATPPQIHHLPDATANKDVPQKKKGVFKGLLSSLTKSRPKVARKGASTKEEAAEPFPEEAGSQSVRDSEQSNPSIQSLANAKSDEVLESESSEVLTQDTVDASISTVDDKPPVLPPISITSEEDMGLVGATAPEPSNIPAQTPNANEPPLALPPRPVPRPRPSPSRRIDSAESHGASDSAPQTSAEAHALSPTRDRPPPPIPRPVSSHLSGEALEKHDDDGSQLLKETESSDAQEDVSTPDGHESGESRTKKIPGVFMNQASHGAMAALASAMNSRLGPMRPPKPPRPIAVDESTEDAASPDALKKKEHSSSGDDKAIEKVRIVCFVSLMGY
ncbi:hypothetical protein HDU96_008025 [Phlyctochytrium bullatum]|nr:hypothetical protein HDU96_008025 [Phlyctochytrium bullatum]